MRVVFLGRSRVRWRQAILQAATLGIYRRWWLHGINKEVDGHDALGLNHRMHAMMLWSAALAPLTALFVPRLGLGAAGYAICLIFLVPTAILQYQTMQRTARMVASSDVRYPAPKVAFLLSLVPIVGSFFLLAWHQGRLNRFWAYERAHPGRGIEIDVDVGADPRFLVELDRARKASFYAGSRFDRRKEARAERRAARRARQAAIRAERIAIREAGGSTPVLPWLRPRRPEHRRLHVTCGRCQTAFDVERDPVAETPLVCPKCGLAEVIPSLSENPLARPEKAAVPTVQVRCPKCSTQFRAVRNLYGPTSIQCPTCGRKDKVTTAPEARAPRVAG